MAKRSNIRVLFVASEADPFVKVGGLADVAGSLPRALRRLRSSSSAVPSKPDVRLVIPYHPIIQTESYSFQQVTEYPVHTLKGAIQVKVFASKIDGLPVYLIAGPPIDQETTVYSADMEEDGYKYVFFSMASLELAKHLNWKPDILHANDWHTATAVYALALNRPTDPFFSHTKSLLTIHNLPYLGSMTSVALKTYGLPPASHSALPPWAQHMALPLGLLVTDAIVAVSPTYAREILSEELGSGLDRFLKTRMKVITGILNGLDVLKWDPTSDLMLPAKYSFDNLAPRLINKSYLQKQLGLESNPRIPLLAMVTRMDPQKGVDLAIHALRTLLQAPSYQIPPFQVVFLGMGNMALEEDVLQLEQDYPHQVKARIMFDERLSHLIYAGADVLLMPSRYEPCGLAQMIAMHYGCVPLAHATGGLKDTIQDPGETEMATGFLFKPAVPEVLAQALQHTLDIYLQDPSQWQEIQIRGMQQDFSWDRSALQYLERYKILLGG